MSAEGMVLEPHGGVAPIFSGAKFMLRVSWPGNGLVPGAVFPDLPNMHGSKVIAFEGLVVS